MAKPTGNDLCYGTTASSTLPDGSEGSEEYELRTITFESSAALTEGEEYAIVIRGSNSDKVWLWGSAEDVYGDGFVYSSSDSGEYWDSNPSSKDAYFNTGVDSSLVVEELRAYFWNTRWKAQTFIAASSYNIAQVTLALSRSWYYIDSTITVSIKKTEKLVKPITPSPENGGVEIDFSELELSWVEGEGGVACNYNVYIGPSGSLFLVSERQAEFSYITNIDEVPTDQKIYWRVDAIAGGQVVEGDVWNFDARPAKVATTTPVDEDTGIKLNATTGGWESPSANSTSYDVYYGTLSGFLSLVSNTENLGYALVADTFDNYGRTSYWRVDAVNQFGTTQGDELWFTTLVFAPPLPSGQSIEYSEGDSGEEPVIVGTPTGENNMITIRKLVAAAANKIWIEGI